MATPRFNISLKQLKSAIPGTAAYERALYPFNPYTQYTKEAKLFRSKQRSKIPWSKIVDDLEPYSLYPRGELQRMLKLYSFFLLYYLNRGYMIDIPYLGQFAGITESWSEDRWYFSKHKSLGEEPNKEHHDIVFRPAPFVRWYLNPKLYTPFKYQKVPRYFRAFDKFQKELYQSDHLNWFEIFPDKKYLEFSLNRLRCNGTIGQYAGMPWAEGRRPKKADTLDGGASRRSKYPTKKLIANPYDH